jgi:hypothetical protein
VTATIARYRPPFISQKRRDTPPFDDCAIESGLMLLGSWTLGEGLLEDDGDTKPLHSLSDSLRQKIGDTSGGLTLADVDDALHVMDPALPPLPRYPGQNPPPVPSATLRLTWAQFRARIIDGHAAIILGYQPGATIGHAIFVARGNEAGPIVMDPWENRPIAWEGERWTWDRLRQFTERRVNGDRFGSADAIACAVVEIGSESTAARVARETNANAAVAIAEADRRTARAEKLLKDCNTAKGAVEGQLRDEKAGHLLTRRALELAEASVLSCQAAHEATTVRAVALTAERDGALQRATIQQERAEAAARDLETATRTITAQGARIEALEARVTELEALPPTDCVTEVNAERARVLAAISDGMDELVAGLR